MRWRDRFLSCMEAVNQAQADDRRDQGPLPQRHRRDDGGHVRAGRVRQGARQRHHHDRPDGRLHRDPVDGEVGAAQRRAAAPAPRRARHLHPAEDPRRELPRDRQVDAAGRRRPHPRRHGRRQARGRPQRRCAATTTRCAWTTYEADPVKGMYFDQDWASMPGVHAGRLGRHPRRADAPAAAPPRRGRDPAVRRRHHRPPDGHRRRRRGQPRRARGDDQGPQRGRATTSPRARRSCARAARSNRALDVALATWGDITFDYESTDAPDVVAPRRRTPEEANRCASPRGPSPTCPT